MAQKQGRNSGGEQLSVEDFGAGAGVKQPEEYYPVPGGVPVPKEAPPTQHLARAFPGEGKPSAQHTAQHTAPPSAPPIHWPTLAENLRHFHDGIMGLVVDGRFDGKVRVLAAKAARALGRLLEPVYEEVVRGVRKEVEGGGKNGP